jgi:hypothetical protein
MITRRLSLMLATLFVLSMTFAAPVFASGDGDWNNGDDHNGCWCDDSNGDHNGDESWCDDNGNGNGDDDDDDDGDDDDDDA